MAWGMRGRLVREDPLMLDYVEIQREEKGGMERVEDVGNKVVALCCNGMWIWGKGKS